jgi:hypothetical protein
MILGEKWGKNSHKNALKRKEITLFIDETNTFSDEIFNAPTSKPPFCCFPFVHLYYS